MYYVFNTSKFVLDLNLRTQMFGIKRHFTQENKPKFLNQNDEYVLPATIVQIIKFVELANKIYDKIA